MKPKSFDKFYATIFLRWSLHVWLRPLMPVDIVCERNMGTGKGNEARMLQGQEWEMELEDRLTHSRHPIGFHYSLVRGNASLSPSTERNTSLFISLTKLLLSGGSKILGPCVLQVDLLSTGLPHLRSTATMLVVFINISTAGTILPLSISLEVQH